MGLKYKNIYMMLISLLYKYLIIIIIIFVSFAVFHVFYVVLSPVHQTGIMLAAMLQFHTPKNTLSKSAVLPLQKKIQF